MSIYAASDLHGYYDLFMKGLDRIGFSDTDYLYVIGDAIDRGPDGIKLLKLIQKNKNMDLLLGNHELMMLYSVHSGGKPICDGIEADIWLGYNGGKVTLHDYLELSDSARIRLLGWLRNRYVTKTVEVNGKTFCLTHSYFDEELINKRYRYADPCLVYEVVWNSVYREDSNTYGQDPYSKYDYTFVTGHVPIQYARRELPADQVTPGLSALWNNNMADIDGGCSYGEDFYDGTKARENGMLFLRLDDLKEFPIRF